jgi:hypothetical protein
VTEPGVEPGTDADVANWVSHSRLWERRAKTHAKEADRQRARAEAAELELIRLRVAAKHGPPRICLSATPRTPSGLMRSAFRAAARR